MHKHNILDSERSHNGVYLFFILYTKFLLEICVSISIYSIVSFSKLDQDGILRGRDTCMCCLRLTSA